MAYDRVAGIDEQYNFPPQVRQATASSNEVKAVISNEVTNQVPGAVSEAIADDQTVVDAASVAVEQVLNGRLQAIEEDIDENRDLHIVPVEDRTYAIPFLDSEDRVAGGFTKEGYFNAELPLQVAGNKGVAFQPVTDNEFAYAFTDSKGYIAFGIKKDGNLYVGDSDFSIDPGNVANVIEGMSKTIPDRIATIGDSLSYGYFGGSPGPTEDSWPAKLAARLPAGVTLTNVATSGFTVDEESVRVGALKVPLTVVGGSIPTTGAVTVTTTASIGFRPLGTVRAFNGSLAGVPGVLRRENSDSEFTFTRTTDGDAVTVTNGTIFQPDFAGHNAETLVIMLGRNDVSYGVTGVEGNVIDHVVNGIKRLVEWHSRDIKRILVMSVTTNTSETEGTAGHSNIVEINRRLSEYMTTRYYDLRRYLVDRAIYDLGITPTATDLGKMAADTLPPSIMDPGATGTGDGTHYSKETAVLVSNRVADYLTTREWIKVA